MGTNATAKSMLDLCSQLITNIQKARNYGDLEKLCDNFSKLTTYAYDEARVEEVIKKIIERSKQDLINLIKEDEAFTRDGAEAIELLQRLITNTEKLRNLSKQRNKNTEIGVIGSMSDVNPLLNIIYKDLKALTILLQKQRDKFYNISTKGRPSKSVSVVRTENP